MATRKKTIRFEASARLQRLIGRGLIPNDEMAIVELVKNAYDAGATSVRIFIQPETTREPGFIRISDNGSGMSEADINDLFMFAGYSERPDQIKAGRRVPTGEKGIERFATDKLGRTLDVYTSKGGEEGIHLSIDWKKIETKGRKKFSEIEASYEVMDVAPILRAKRGTVLRVGHLSSAWNSSHVETLNVWLSDLLSPYTKPSNFRMELEVAGSRARRARD